MGFGTQLLEFTDSTPDTSFLLLIFSWLLKTVHVIVENLGMQKSVQ